MLRIDDITKDWKDAGSFPAQINLYGLWDEHCFLRKSGDLGTALHIGGIDYESLDHAGRDYSVKSLEAAFRSMLPCGVWLEPSMASVRYRQPIAI
jgi:type IV secretory pathway VirB4 component